jgi:hypothetical protein
VSQFLLQPEERRNFFHQIAVRMRSQGYLINADIAYDRSASTYPELLDIWLRIMTSAGMPVEMVRAKISAAYGRDVAVLPPSEVASIIAAGGFDPPTCAVLPNSADPRLVCQTKYYSSISRITRQGFPAANTPAGISFVTTLPAPMTDRSPILTPGQTMTPPPTHTSSPIVTGLPNSNPVRRCAAFSGCVAA